MKPKRKVRNENDTLEAEEHGSESNNSDNESLISAVSRTSRKSNKSVTSRRSGTPLSITLRSHCKQHGATCTEGHGLEFRNRISPSPSQKQRSPTRRSRGSPESIPRPISRNEKNGLSKRTLDMSLKDSIENTVQRRVLRTRTVDITQASSVVLDDSLQQLLNQQRTATKEIAVSASGITTALQAMSESYISTSSQDCVTKMSEKHFIASSRTHKTSDYSSDEDGKRLAFLPSKTHLPLPPLVAAVSAASAVDQTQGMAQRVLNSINSATNYLSTMTTSTSRSSTYNAMTGFMCSSDEDESTVQKTDYTYAHSLSYRPKVTPDRVITPPNMSRRSLRVQTIHAQSFEHVSSPVLAMSGTETDSNSTFGLLTRRRESPPRRVMFSREASSNGNSLSLDDRYRRLTYGPDGDTEEEEEGEEEYALTPPAQLPLAKRVWWHTQRATKSVVRRGMGVLYWMWTWLYLTICYALLLDTWVLVQGAPLRQRLAPYKKWAVWFLIIPIILTAGGFLWNNDSSLLASTPSEENTADKPAYIKLFGSDDITSYLASAWTALSHYPWTWLRFFIGLNCQVWNFLWDNLGALWHIPAAMNLSVLPLVTSVTMEPTIVSGKTVPFAPENSAKPEIANIPIALLQNQNVVDFLVKISKDPQFKIQPTQDTKILLTELTQQLSKSQHDHETLAVKWQDIMQQQEKIKLEQDGQRLQGRMDKTGLEGEIAGLRDQLDASLVQLEALKAQLTTCCSSSHAYNSLVDDRMLVLLRTMMGSDATADVDFTKFAVWLNQRLAARKEYEVELNATLDNWRKEMKGWSSRLQLEKQELVDMIRAQVEDKLDAFMTLQLSKSHTLNLTPALPPSSLIGFNAASVEAIVREHLRRYDADRTGMADYALESAGASIQSTRCTEDYKHNKAVLSIFGINLWHKSNSPSIALLPDMSPGKCWSFKGAQGYLLIRLAAAIRPTAFTMEHISRNISLSGRIDSAPKKFSVWGFKSEQDQNSVILGQYVYNEWGEPLQTFLVQHEDPDVYPMVQLNIESNHGNINFTCLYRFRVHGLLHRAH